MTATENETGPRKQKSGAQKRAERDRRNAAVSRALRRAGEIEAPPDDVLEIQGWAVKAAARLAHAAMASGEVRLARECLGVIGMLWPRAELIQRAQKELRRRQGQEEEDPLTPLASIPGPLPAARFRREHRPEEA